ncbi:MULTISPECIES: helix-turn-helix domain-containing protein [Streptomyces]|uniref:XRE family transcriptional regulator n=1 Tax=Streptomyces dengpaensis TaxID=2049881 RepID=A0ABM6SKQ3_9ACTN|nr:MULTISPECIES: helix-turn-helix transcriptional regulator [Streptomyces]AVH54648.1 XRE family transcriptional regulator [Streptomyces dengpaensis]PIB05179.1 transcriptional regulator [Streptomyces sp. HG99]
MSQPVPETDIRDFLRTRRARITPQQAGLPPHPGVRRVPGLRREEVAQLAGVSVDYYVRLERGRTTSVSAAVLDAVARALQLNDTERNHLFALANPTRQRPQARAAQRARPGLLRALENVAGVPALLLGHRLDVLATNHLARAFYRDFEGLPAGEWNMARYMFLDPAARDLYVDWPETARENVGMLRLHASHHPRDPRLAQLVNELSVGDRDFRRWWSDHDVYQPKYGSKRYHHPLVGDLTLGFEAFKPMGDPDQTLGLYTVEPGSPSENALRLLASWTADNTHIQPEEGLGGCAPPGRGAAGQA